ncbi:MAG: hypothetical protein JWL77_336 [Chthonomonadaceae bacterium]|nr:hypothetical protein [Chthonomonadaceae bacterium]
MATYKPQAFTPGYPTMVNMKHFLFSMFMAAARASRSPSRRSPLLVRVLALTLLASACLLPLSAQAQKAGGARRRSPDEVLLICNTNSPVSRAIADDYAQKRHIKHRLAIQCPDSAISRQNETLSLAAYTAAIETPVRKYLEKNPKIDFIVLTKGIPIRILGAGLGSNDEHTREPEATRGRPSVDSYLAALDYYAQPVTFRKKSGRWSEVEIESRPRSRKISITGSGAIGFGLINRYWNATEPFSHAKFGGYLVTRLDGYTEADAKALVSRSLAAEAHLPDILKRGKVLLDVQPAFGQGDKATQPGPITDTIILNESAYSEFNADMRHAHDMLMQRGIPDELDLSETFIGQRSDLLGYFSWGSNDEKYSPAAYQSLSFAPGSLCDTAVSTSARTFLPTRGGQSLLVDLIAHGLTCGKGYVEEPLLQAIASPTIALDRYTSGYTMAESLYAASHFVGWEDVVIGDPLCCPYGRRTQKPIPTPAPPLQR